MTSGQNPIAPRRRRRFLLRIYLNLLVLLILTGAGIAIVERYVITPDAQNDIRSLTRWMISQAASERRDPVRFHKELDTMRTELRLSATFYDLQGAQLGSSVDPPFPPLSSEDLAALRADDFAQHQVDGRRVVGFFENNQLSGYAVTSRPSAPLRRYRGMFFVGVLMLVIMLASVPLARSVVLPLEKMARTTRAFGAGDLAARTHLDRNDEIGDLARAFDEMAERVTVLLRSEKELLANVSHELRTPLARIRVVLDLASEVDAERSRAYLREIAEDLAELERLVDDVLTAARLDLAEGRTRQVAPPIHLEATDLRALVDGISKRFRQRYPDRQLELQGWEHLPVIDADGPMLRRVVDNLLDNARKYSDAGSVIRITAHTAPDSVSIEVADQGIGIEPADLDYVFRPFFRSDTSRTRTTGGIGLGLTLARRIVEAHAGHIELESQPGKGTTVRFTLPCSPDLTTEDASLRP